VTVLRTRRPGGWPGMINQDTAPGFGSAVTLAFCFLASALEGFDSASMGMAAPKLAPALHLSAQHLGLVLSGMPLGMFLGALLGGRLADAVGRKIMLVIAVTVIGAFQLATAFTARYVALIAVRVCCGVGVGAAMSNVIALASEAAGEKGSLFNVAFVMAGLPAGGTTASLIVIAAREQGDWRTNFYIGGLAPLLLAAIMVFALPESREFLKARLEARTGKISLRSTEGILALLFGRGRTLATLSLWISYFTTSVIVYVLVNWTPTLMTLKGFSKTDAVSVGLPIGIGGLIAPILTSRLMQQRRSPGLLILCYAAVAAGLVGLAQVGHDFAMALVAIAVPATLVQVLSFTLAGLAPQYYPTLVRGTGTGAAVGAARLGAICGPATVGFLLGAGLGPTQVLWSLVPVAVVAGLTAYMLLVNPAHQETGLA
jgi:MFS transporter, AAHS family, 3-hydroxyphenylpropionic acid transporter